MATITKNGLKHGTIGDQVFYVVNGKQRVRAVAKKYTAPKKGSRVYASRSKFGVLSTLAHHLLPAIKIGFHKEALRAKSFEHNVFISVNGNNLDGDNIDYPRLVVSRGIVPAPRFANLTLSKGGVLRVDFDPTLRSDKAEVVYLAVFCPDKEGFLLSDPVNRTEGRLKMRIPRSWLTHAVHAYGFARRTGLHTSPTEYLPVVTETRPQN
jgi:hypothetical protein